MINDVGPSANPTLTVNLISKNYNRSFDVSGEGLYTHRGGD